MLPKNLYVVRHFHSEGNQVVKMDEEQDPSGYSPEFIATHGSQWRLSKLGRSQAPAVKKWFEQELQNKLPDAILVSPYIRTMETAALIFPQGRFLLRNELIERSWGEMERMPISEREKLFELSLHDKESVPFYWQPPNGESISDVTLRAREVLGKLHRDHPHQESVVIVAHGEMNQALDAVIRKINPIEWPTQRPRTRNGQVLHYSREDEHGAIHAKLVRYRSIWPPDLQEGDTEWHTILRREFSAEDLLTQVRKAKHFFEENREGNQ